MDQPRRAMQGIVAHRLKREAKVTQAMRSLGLSSAETLLAHVYDDVNPKLLPMAMRSLRAHLFKLRDEGVAAERDGRWGLNES
jgi:hypothetical protein